MEHALQWFVKECEERNISLPGLARELHTGPDLDAAMADRLQVMREAAEGGYSPKLRSVTRMTGGGAAKMQQALEEGRLTGRNLHARAESIALSIAEYNAAMGRIVAAPTAGACGILPAVLFSMQYIFGYQDEDLIDALLVAALVGEVIEQRASVSGARGGCQAECGSASAMAAAAGVYLRGGGPQECMDAAGFALMNIMGLVCDPVGGLVEVPCVYRNVSGAVQALAAADLALSGIPCPLPPDEIIDAMKAVGDSIPAALRETGEGGCAACPSAAALLSRRAKKAE